MVERISILKNRLTTFLFILFLSTNAATFTAVITGNWNDGVTWGNVSPGVVGVDFPGVNDIVNIPSGIGTVTVPAFYTAKAKSLTLNSNLNNVSCTLSLTGTSSALIISGDLNMNCFIFSGGFSTTTVRIDLNGGALQVNGNLTATSKDQSGPKQNQLITTGSGVLTVGGDLTLINDGTTTAKLNMNTTGSSLKVGGNISLGTLDNGSGTKGTIYYYGSSGSQTIINSISYYNLTVSGGATKLLGGNIDVNGAFYISSGATFNSNNYNINIAGDWTNDGSFLDQKGTVTFDGASTIWGNSVTTFYDVIVSGTLIGHTNTFSVEKNFSNNGTFNHNNGTIN